MAHMIVKFKRGQFFIVGLILLFLILLAVFGLELLFSGFERPSPIQGEPKKDPATGLYTVYVVASGHRDLTFFHRNLHANIHVDAVSFYFENPPDPLSGSSLLDFSKSIHATVSVRSSSLGSPLISTFDARVSLGARWSRVLIYRLPSGTYIIDAQGLDQDGFTSSTSSQLILP